MRVGDQVSAWRIQREAESVADQDITRRPAPAHLDRTPTSTQRPRLVVYSVPARLVRRALSGRRDTPSRTPSSPARPGGARRPAGRAPRRRRPADAGPATVDQHRRRALGLRRLRRPVEGDRHRPGRASQACSESSPGEGEQRPAPVGGLQQHHRHLGLLVRGQPGDGLAEPGGGGHHRHQHPVAAERGHRSQVAVGAGIAGERPPAAAVVVGCRRTVVGGKRRRRQRAVG